MEKLDFHAIVPVVRTTLAKALDEEPTETRSRGPFGNEAVRYTFARARVFVDVILDRGEVSVSLRSTLHSDEIYDFDYLRVLLFPWSRGNIVNLAITELVAIVKWIAEVSSMPDWKCYREAYKAFEQCENLQSLARLRESP